MKHSNTKQSRKLAALLAAILSVSMMLTGCMGEILDILLEEDTYHEKWWENPAVKDREEDFGWEFDEDYEDYDDFAEYGSFEDYEDGEYGWWNALDESWSQSDWEYLEDGIWGIFDEETQCIYLYDEEAEEYAAMDAEENTYLLDTDTGEWIPAE